MDWALKHLQLIIAIAGAVAWWISQRRLAKQGSPEPRKEATFEDPDLAERTRRIREEIQRKIEQRARAYTQLQPPVPRAEPAAPAPVRDEMVVQSVQPAPLADVAAAQRESKRAAAIVLQQSALAERLRRAVETKAAAMLSAKAESPDRGEKEDAAAARLALSEDLGSPLALRRAFVLREILGPPVGLR